MCELRRHVYANTVDRITVKKLVNHVFPTCKCEELQRLHQERKECNMAVAALAGDDCEMMMDELDECAPPPTDETEETNNTVDTSNKEVLEISCDLNEIETREAAASTDVVPNGVLENAAKEVPVEQGPTAEKSSERMNLFEVEETANGNKQSGNQVKNEGRRSCSGHDVAMVIDELVNELDMREENIVTLLCYLELHPNRWIQVLQPIKSTCSMKFYGGHAQLRAVAQKVPVVAAAVAINAKKSEQSNKSNALVFSVVEVADRMGWDLDPVCSELRALQWNTSLAVNSSHASLSQSGILVEFLDMSFHIRSPGDLTPCERDKVCDFLEDRILAEEQSQLQGLSMVYYALKKVSCAKFWQCDDDVKQESDLELKKIIQSYFEDSTDQTKKELEKLTQARNKDSVATSTCASAAQHVNWDLVARDIRTLVSIHHDHSFTGRSLARIFHGIESPCYPASVWGRDRRFWRKHLYVDFNSLRKFATKELLSLRYT